MGPQRSSYGGGAVVRPVALIVFVAVLAVAAAGRRGHRPCRRPTVSLSKWGAKRVPHQDFEPPERARCHGERSRPDQSFSEPGAPA